MESIKVGDVVQDKEGYRGLVRYKGPLPKTGAGKEFLGLEWIDNRPQPKDKKAAPKEKSASKTAEPHVFEPTHGRSGSYIPAKKAISGVSFARAVKDRYEPESDELTEEHEGISNVVGGPRYLNSGSVVEIEKVGMEEIKSKQKLKTLREIAIERASVSCAGSEEEKKLIEDCFSGNVKELSLANNLLNSWEKVVDITSNFKSLEHLNLAHNVLRHVHSETPNYAPGRFSLDNLKVLVLNKTFVTLSQIQLLDESGAFPNLTDLCLAHNELSTLHPTKDLIETEQPKGSYFEWVNQNLGSENDIKSFTASSFVHGFPNLTSLDISGNQLKGWTEVWRLSRLPRLARLNVADNPISDIFFESIEDLKLNGADTVSSSNTSCPDGDTVTEAELERRRLADEFAKKVEKQNSPQVDELEEEEASTEAKDEPQPTKGIMLSNGFVVPIPMSREKARKTDARLFQGEGVEGGVTPFHFLTHLNIDLLNINDVNMLNVLDDYPKLSELRIVKCRSKSGFPSSNILRPRLIASIKSLNTLNGSAVRPRERSDAEKLYLRNAAKTYFENKTLDKTAFPRFDELVKLHGNPLENKANENGFQRPTGMDKFVRLTFRSFDPHTCTVKPKVNNIPLDTSVSDLKVLCQTWFKVDKNLQRLYYRANVKDFGHPMLLDEEDVKIGDLGFQSGAEVLLEAAEPSDDRLDI